MKKESASLLDKAKWLQDIIRDCAALVDLNVQGKLVVTLQGSKEKTEIEIK